MNFKEGIDRMWQFPPFRLDVANQSLYRGDVRIPLMPKPFSILQYLVEHAGRLVTQDELLTAIWPETHVQPEVLRRYILEIRRVLGDHPETPQFIETITKRGYRFIAEATAIEPKPADAPEITPNSRPRSRATLASIIILLSGLALAGGSLWSRWRPAKPAGKDTILLAEFTNLTGDPVFDQTLRQGLAVQLEQSPFLSVVSEEQVQQTLRQMQRPPGTSLTPDVAAEACQRARGTIFLSGSIAQIGARYNLILRASICSSRESLASTEALADDRNHVLEALGKVSSDMREKLGESHANVRKFDIPLVEATTSSLEALQAYSLGYEKVVTKGDSGAAIPFLERAVEVDPNFAMAYSTLGLTYWNVGEPTHASENIRKAFELRTGRSELEKLRIESEYLSLVSNNLDKARRAYEIWAQTYPRDWTPRNRLGVIDTVLGQHDQALAEYRAALQLYPESALIRSNLVAAYLALDRIVEARSMVYETIRKNRDSPGLRVNVYRLAFLENDRKGMEQQLSAGEANPGLKAQLLSYEAASAAYRGQLNKARNLSREAAVFAHRAEEKEAASTFEADQALREALFGNETTAKSLAESVLRLSTGPDVQFRAALALATVGDLVRGRRLADDLDKRFPEDTIVQFIYLPTLRAQLSLVGGDPGKSIELLQTALPYELGGALYPAYIRGVACLAAHQSSEARSEFEKILNHRGVVFNSPIGALANLQIARAFALRGDSVKAGAAYQNFLKLWNDADPGVPVLTQAKAEFARFNR